MNKTTIFMESIGQLGLTKSQFNAVKSLYEAINDSTLTVDPKYEPLLAKYGIDKIVNILKEHEYDIHTISISEEKAYTYYTMYKVFIQGQELGENDYTGRCIEVRIELFPHSNDQFNGIIDLVDYDRLVICQDGTTSDSNTPNSKYKTVDDMCMALENFLTKDTKQKEAALSEWGDRQLSNDIRNMFND